MAQAAKFGVKKLVTGVGSLGIFNSNQESQVKIIVANAGVMNTLAIYGKIQGQNTFQLIDTVVGSQTKLIDIALFDFLDLELITYDTLSNYVDIAGSGFGGNSSSAGGGTPSQLPSNVIVTNFPSTQNVSGIVTALGPLTNAELRAAPVEVNDGVSSGGVYGILDMPTANTAYEVKVGSSALGNRKLLIVTTLAKGIFWGTNSLVTVSTGMPLSMSQVLTFTIDPTSNFKVYFVSSTAAKASVAEIP